MIPLGIDYLTLYGTHPIDFIKIAAAANCQTVGFFRQKIAFPFPSHPPSLFEDAQLRRDVVRCLDDHGISISLIDAFFIHPKGSVNEYRPFFDMFGELGVKQINAVSRDDWKRTVDEVALLGEIAAPYDCRVNIETSVNWTVRDLPLASKLIREVNRPNVKIMLDTMHVSRTGGGDTIQDIDPGEIGYVQICDGMMAMPPDPETYMDQALYDRMIPGQGEFPLVKLLSHVPQDVIVSMELPMRTLEKAGVPPLERVRMAAEGSRKILAAARGPSQGQ